MPESYKFTYIGGSGEIIEKKSRFIATVHPVKTEEEALSFIDGIRRQYWDASHNCTAFTIGKNHQLTRCSDDREPSGTAGRPMLDVLLGEDLHDTAVVVTRYFGGTLLGTGGLVRAYTAAVREGLKKAVILEKRPGVRLSIHTDYNGVGKIQYILNQSQIPILRSEYTDSVFLEALAPVSLLTSTIAAITEGTSGQALLSPGDHCQYALPDGEILLFEEEGQE
ncbi:MAG: YigZ family protein [Lachnospiraceae bacterium]|jgi:uncharacterized YigZ family protein|nr:YigZ family protein [Lachnospiraceae bacterium]MCI9305366.1 YigZ family protein [Lachnospiraceae bacterium]